MTWRRISGGPRVRLASNSVPATSATFCTSIGSRDCTPERGPVSACAMPRPESPCARTPVGRGPRGSRARWREPRVAEWHLVARGPGVPHSAGHHQRFSRRRSATARSLLESLIVQDDYDYVDRRSATVYALHEWLSAGGSSRVRLRRGRCGPENDQGDRARLTHGIFSPSVFMSDSLFRPNRNVLAGSYLLGAVTLDYNPGIDAGFVGQESRRRVFGTRRRAVSSRGSASMREWSCGIPGGRSPRSGRVDARGWSEWDRHPATTALSDRLGRGPARVRLQAVRWQRSGYLAGRSMVCAPPLAGTAARPWFLLPESISRTRGRVPERLDGADDAGRATRPHGTRCARRPCDKCGPTRLARDSPPAGPADQPVAHVGRCPHPILRRRSGRRGDTLARPRRAGAGDRAVGRDGVTYDPAPARATHGVAPTKTLR